MRIVATEELVRTNSTSSSRQSLCNLKIRNCILEQIGFYSIYLVIIMSEYFQWKPILRIRIGKDLTRHLAVGRKNDSDSSSSFFFSRGYNVPPTEEDQKGNPLKDTLLRRHHYNHDNQNHSKTFI